MIQPGIVLAGPEKDTGIGVSRFVDLPLALACDRFIDAVRDHLCNPVFKWSVQADTEDVRPFPQRHHSGPAEDDGSRGVSHLP